MGMIRDEAEVRKELADLRRQLERTPVTSHADTILTQRIISLLWTLKMKNPKTNKPIERLVLTDRTKDLLDVLS